MLSDAWQRSRPHFTGRCVLEDSSPGQHLGRIKLEREWDAILLVVLDVDFEPVAIFESPWTTPSSMSRSGSMIPGKR